MNRAQFKIQNSKFKIGQVCTDQMGRELQLPQTPARVVSLVPSQTELLFDLGLEKRIIGITKFCIHPSDKVKSITKIGGTKKLNLELIRSLKPDLIIGNKEENEEHQIKELMNEFPVWMSDISNLDDALEMIQKVGDLCNKKQEALKISEQIANDFDSLKSDFFVKRKVAYLIWKEPYLFAGKNSFIDSLFTYCGFENVIQESRYPEKTMMELKELSPEWILLSSEPYPFKEKHVEEFKAACPNSTVKIVDGELFSWYGSRLLKSADYFRQLLKN